MGEPLLVLPDGEPRGALLVLSGSSGRVQGDRCRALAAHGWAALSYAWFAHPGVLDPARAGSLRGPEGSHSDNPARAGLVEVSLESFLPHLDRLAELGTPRLGVVGTSFGALAALLLGVLEPRLDLVVALAPSHVVWAAPVLTDEGRPVERSSFAWRGDPLHFVPTVDQVAWRGPALTTPRQVYEASLRTFAARVPAATVAVEEVTADLVLAAGGDDRVWPAALFAQEVRARREAYGLPTTVLLEPAAGHRVVLPGEEPAQPAADYGYGGTEEADRRLGERVLEAMAGRST